MTHSSNSKHKFQKSEYNSSLTVDSTNEKFIEFSITDCDETSKLEVYLDPDEIHKLSEILEAWKKSFKANNIEDNKFSWFSGKSED